MSEKAANFPAEPRIYPAVNTNRAARVRLMILSGTALVAAAAVGITVGLARTGAGPAGTPAAAATPESGSVAAQAGANPAPDAGTLSTPPVVDSPSLPAPVSSTPKSSRTAAPATGTPRVSSGPVRLALPPGWRLSRTDGPVGRSAGCVLAPGQAAATRADRCALAVQYVGDHPAGELFENPDAVGGFMDNADGCPDGSSWLAIRAPHASTSTVDGRHAEVRTLTMDCAGRDVAVQQWAITGHPYVVMTSHLPVGSPLAATVRTIATTAELPARTGPSRVDFGLVNGIRTDAKGVILSLDREIHKNPFDEYDGPYSSDVNENPRRYQLRVAPNARVRAASMLCGVQALTTSPVDGLGGTPCSLDTLVKLSRTNTPWVTVWLTYDARGQVNGIAEEFRS
jgi:hypothetical protein